MSFILRLVSLTAGFLQLFFFSSSFSNRLSLLEKAIILIALNKLLACDVIDVIDVVINVLKYRLYRLY